MLGWFVHVPNPKKRFRSMNTIISNLWTNLQVFVRIICSFLMKLSSFLRHSKDLLLQVLLAGVNKNDEERLLIAQLVQAMHKEGLVSTDNIIQVLTCFYSCF